MAELSRQQLIDLVTREVVAVLRQRGMLGGASTPSAMGPRPSLPGAGRLPGAGARADVRPPVGVCTGDYSQFPELAGRLYGQAAPSPAPPAPVLSHTPASPPIALTGIITANQLQDAMNRASDGIATLAHDARLTPLAADLARLHPQRLRRATAADTAPHHETAALPWQWWIDGSCPAASAVTDQRRDRVRPSAAGRNPAALPTVVRDLANSIRARRIAGGILFVHNAARAACFANRCPSIRAVVGTCGEAVEQGVIELGANVLVIEYPHVGPQAMAAMIDRMLQQPPRAPAAVERELADLHRCG